MFNVDSGISRESPEEHMASRIERLLELMTWIKASQGTFTAQELAQEFGVSRRTMLRDLQSLSEMGMPLSSTPGPAGGYTLAFKHRSVSLSLTAEEAVELITAYEYFHSTPSPFRESNLSVIAKLRTALAPEVLRELERLQSRVALVGLARMYEAPFLSRLLEAAMEQVHLRIEYESRTGSSARLIFPYGVISGLGFWYCGCYDYSRNAHSWLRADRITSVEQELGHLPRATMSLQEWLQACNRTGSKTVELRARVTAGGMKILDWSHFREGLTFHAKGDASIKMCVPVDSLEFYARQFLPLGKAVVVRSPQRLIDLIKQQARDLLALYD